MVLVYFADDSLFCKVSFLKCQDLCEGAALMKNPVPSLLSLVVCTVTFSDTLMSLGSLIHTYITTYWKNLMEKCHKSPNPSWRQGCRFNFNSGKSNVCISLWMRPATGRPAVWQAASLAGLPETRGPSAGWVHTLASGVTDGIQPLPARGCSTAKGLGNSQLERLLRHRQTSVHTSRLHWGSESLCAKPSLWASKRQWCNHITMLSWECPLIRQESQFPLLSSTDQVPSEENLFAHGTSDIRARVSVGRGSP